MATDTLSKNRYALFPYLFTGLLPFGVGTLLAGVAGFPVRWEVWLAGTLALAALILAAVCSRLIFAPAEGRWPGQGLLSPKGARTLAYASLTLTAAQGLILQFGAHTGYWTIPLGGLGILGSYFYFAPPFSWHRRGFGEVVGGLCFGFLPVATGLYLQTGHLLTEALLYGLPLTFAGFNFFLLHGFPGPEPEGPPPGRSLAAGALIFTVVNILTIAALVLDLLFPANPLPLQSGFILLIILAVFNQELVKRKDYRRERGLDRLCVLACLLHFLMGLVFAISLWHRW
jgi:1,4-dihydroxy-2-naphthoate octaprenyltransferase